MTTVIQRFYIWMGLMSDNASESLAWMHQQGIIQELEELTGADREFLNEAVNEVIAQVCLHGDHLSGEEVACEVMSATVHMAFKRECWETLLRERLRKRLN